MNNKGLALKELLIATVILCGFIYLVYFLVNLLINFMNMVGA